MGTTLTGTTPQDTYDSLIKVTDNAPLTGSLKKLTDGLGNDSSLSLSTTAASLSGTLAVSSTTTSAGLILSTNDAVLATDGSVSKHSVVGLSLKAVAGSVFNFSLYSEDDTAMMVNPTGGNNLRFISQIEVSAGIKFPATQFASADANTLDDYEEGTWTPNFTLLSGSVASFTSSGSYTKIGRQVSLTLALDFISTTAAVIDLITGMPFASQNTNQVAIGAVREKMMTGNMYQWEISTNTTTGGLRRYDNNNAILNGFSFIGTLTYFV